ncbi:cobalamin-dependent protein [bacterium]|nr:cobalamin-dependent protein [candidate division CSSED10-310 bacterium]
MARILLIFPPSLYRNFTPPLNLAYLAGVLEKSGHEVKVVDLSALHNPYSVEDVKILAKEFNPLWIGVTLNIVFIQPAYEFAQELKPLGIPLVAGGPHPSLMAEETLTNGYDIVVRGEGESTVVSLTSKLINDENLDDLPGISFVRKTGQIVHNPAGTLIADLDKLPFPAKHLFPKAWYTQNTPTYQIYGAIFSGRGCPANCYYCYKGVFGHGCRLRSAENVFSEMLHLHETHNVTAFEFLDDAFSADLSRVERLCDMILEKKDFSPAWQCTTRMDLITQDLLKKMKKAGCFRIFYGVESGDMDTLFRVNKHLDLNQAKKVLKWTREVGIRSIVGFMWGFPWDSPSSIRASIKYLKTLSPVTDEFNPLGILIPVPGTHLFDIYADRYDLKQWWMSEKYGSLYRKNTYFPYFQRRFYNDFNLLDDGFFPFSTHVKRLIKKGTSFIGRHNLFHSLPLYRSVIVYIAVLISKGLFKVHPMLEETVFSMMRRIKSVTAMK